MVDEDDQDREDRQARALVRQTGITLQQAKDLVRLLGTEPNSLLREARILKRQSDALKGRYPEEK